MNTTRRFSSRLRPSALVLAAACLLSSPAMAQVQSYDLKADTTTVAMPDGTSVDMWGFGLLSDPQVSVPGPLLEVPAGTTTLEINLTNNLAVPVSIVIPGQSAALSPATFVDGQGRTRVRSFAAETAPGATLTYAWSNLKPGTFLYLSGTHPALQVHMGLYGGMTMDAGPGEGYAGVVYDRQVVLLFSEVDPALAAAAAPAQPLNYRPRYFLVNGQPFASGQPPMLAGAVGETVLIRLLNAGLKSHAPTLQDDYLQLVAEDGNLYPYPREQYSTLLAPGKTVDALWQPSRQGTYGLYDRQLHLTSNGMTGGGHLAQLAVGTLAGAPSALDDVYSVLEDDVLAAFAGGVPPGVLDNDSDPDSDPLTAMLYSDVSGGTLVLNDADGSFTYTPDANFNGVDVFTYRASDGLNISDLASVRITVDPVNDAPVGQADSYQALVGSPLVVAAPGVLGNDLDIDGDVLTAVVQTLPSLGTVSLSADGSFTYTATSAGSDSFSYVAGDGLLWSDPVTVSLTVSVAVNSAPVAVDDYDTVIRNSPGDFIDLVANDTDVDGNLDHNSVFLVTQPTRGGTVSVVTNGVIYHPKPNFRGTDVFTYTVSDLDGAPSNEATVRVNVVRP